MYVHMYFMYTDESLHLFVGMSFGGSLATAIVANALHDNLLLNRDLILQSLACITFGQPVVACAKLDELISERDFLADVFHCIYTEEDVVPLLFKYCFYKRSIGKKVHYLDLIHKKLLTHIYVWY